MKCGIKKRKDYFYFVDKQGDVSMRKLKGGSDIKIHKCHIRKQTGLFYYVDEQGDVSCIKESEIDKYPKWKEMYDEEKFNEEKILKTKHMQDEEEKLRAERYLRQKIELEERERLKVQRLRYEVRKKLFEEEFKDMAQDGREPIPEEARHEVWRRDGGKCVKCGSREKLEYDHIIPIAKGGSSTVRNIELLCEKCNREKRDNI